MSNHWLWYAVGRLTLYWLLFFVALAVFAFSPYWINGWEVGWEQWLNCGAFALWGAAHANLGHEIMGRGHAD